MADDDDDASSLIARLVICLIAAASAAVVVTFYHCITTGHILTILRRSGRTAVPQPPAQRRTSTTVYEQDQSQQQNSSIENSLAELIPSHKYQKGDGVGGLVAEHDGMCAVCLSDFEEGEMLRTLPECMHSYHAPCIDMWLYSHSNCPMCRTNAAPSTSPQMLMHLLESANSETPPTSRPRVALFPLQQQQMPATRHN